MRYETYMYTYICVYVCVHVSIYSVSMKNAVNLNDAH